MSVHDQPDSEPVDVLLVENNPGDIRLTQEALRESRLLDNLHVVHDGQEALDFLFQEGDYQTANRPNLVLLDLDLPSVSGEQVLRELNQDDDRRNIPVVVLTTSDSQDDIETSYELQANCYVTKPLDLEEFSNTISSLEQFWFGVAKLPK